MTRSTSEPAERSGDQQVADRGADSVIDLRYPEAQWTYRQLQARVADARDRLVQAEAEAGAREPITDADQVPDRALVDAPAVIAKEWGETAVLSASRLVEADVEVRRIRETAEIEARALETEAEFLRIHPVVDSRFPAAAPRNGPRPSSAEGRP